MARGFVSLPISGGTGSSVDWVRPSDWLPMPTVLSTEQKFVGLHAIFENEDNHVSFNFTTSTGQFRVDWGDGSTPTLHNSGSFVDRKYDYSTYDTGNTTLSSRGYKQVLITVTPVSGTFSTFRFQTGMATGFLDCILSMPNASNNNSILFTSASYSTVHPYLERVDFKAIGSCTNMSYMFQNCYLLQEVLLPNTAAVTNMSSMFNGCSSLRTVPLLNTAAVTNMSDMFFNCFSLRSIPTLSTASVNTSFNAFIRSAFHLTRCQMVFNQPVQFVSNNLSINAIREIFNNLTQRSTTTAISFSTISGIYGTTKNQRTFTFSITNGSKIIPTTSTSLLSIGMEVTGTGSPLTSAVSVTFQDIGDTVTLNNHGLENNDEINFASITSTSGLALNTRYYIVNKTTNTFQVATTIGGSPLPLTTDGSGTMRHRSEIVSMIPDTSITMSRPMRATGSYSLTFSLIKPGTAILKNWTVSVS